VDSQGRVGHLSTLQRLAKKDTKSNASHARPARKGLPKTAQAFADNEMKEQ
jgi:hypothetical protein